MKILLSHRYFWPDTPPYAAILRTIAEDLANADHQVQVFASRPSYRSSKAAPTRETLGKVVVHRTWVFREHRANPVTRALNVVLYCGGLFFHVLRTRPELVTASTFPPVFAGWWASLAARLVGAQFIYHMQDIHPEVSKFSGGWLGRKLPFRLLTWLDNQTLRRASAVVVLSEDMANTVHSRGAGHAPIQVIGNFLLDAFGDAHAIPTELRKGPGKRRVIFAGNLGRFQNLLLLAEGVAQCFGQHPDLELFFLGDGAALPDLQARWSGNSQVRFGPFLPFAQARTLIAESEVGLVSLTSNIYRVSYPSKVLTYLGLGLPVLAVVEPTSMLARTIRANGLGAVPEAPTPTAIGQALENLLNGSNARARVLKWHGENAAAYASLNLWRNVIGNLKKPAC